MKNKLPQMYFTKSGLGESIYLQPHESFRDKESKRYAKRHAITSELQRAFKEGFDAGVRSELKRRGEKT